MEQTGAIDLSAARPRDPDPAPRTASKNSNATVRLRPMLNEAVLRHGRGENVLWETGLMPIADPNGGMEVVLLLMVWLPGPLIGTSISGTTTIRHPAGVTDEKANDLIRDFLDSLRESRSEQISAMEKEAANDPKMQAALDRSRA